MIFERLIITNMFCYQGEVEFKLTPPVDGRNIAVIEGRNGQGKTSFLNCMKLLFGGVTDELRDNALPRNTPSHNQYVWGAPHLQWDGILNREARRQSEAEFSILLEAHDQANAIRICRQWNRYQGGPRSYAGTLNVMFNSRPLPDTQAQELLHDLLPPKLLSFYFYDGELIQNLATLDRGSLQPLIVRMLNLAPVQELALRLADFASSWALEGADHANRNQLAVLAGEILTLEKQRELKAESLQRARDSLADCVRRRPTLEREVEILRERGLGERKQSLLAELKQINKAIRHNAAKLVNEVAPISPILVTPELSARTDQKLNEITHPKQSASDAQDELIGSLVANLPGAVFDGPPFSEPRLFPGQVEHYKKRLVRMLQSYSPDAETLSAPPLLSSLTPNVADILRGQMRAHGGAVIGHHDLTELLRALNRDREIRASLELEIEQIMEFSAEEEQRFRRLNDELGDLRQRIGVLEASIGPLANDLSQASRELTAKQTEHARLMMELQRKQRHQGRASLASRSERTISSLLDHAKEARRRQIEESMTVHFRQMFSSSGQISRFSLSDAFELTLHDSADRPIGVSNVSAGMKQLIAMALLWALKDANGRRIPVIIDTPLARLDHAHQESVLQHYLPQASEQVIVLPTDSELTVSRRQTIAQHLYRHLRLHNKRGADTKIEYLPLASDS